MVFSYLLWVVVPVEKRRKMSVKARRASGYQEGPAEGDCARGGDNGRCATGVLVTRRTDDTGDPIGYLLMSSDTA